MDIYESIYEGLVEPSYKKTTRADSNRAVHSRLKRGDSASSNTYSEMSESSGKRRKRNADHPKVGTNPHVSSMAPDIHNMNARSWETLVLGMLKVGILRNEDMTPQTKMNLIGSKIIMLFLTLQFMKAF